MITTLLQHLIAYSVLVNWTPVVSSDVAGYHVYWGYAPKTYSGVFTVNGPSTNSMGFNNVTPGKIYYYAVSSFSPRNLESTFSNDIAFARPSVSYTVAMTPYINGMYLLTINTFTGAIVALQSSPNLIVWKTLRTFTAQNDVTQFSITPVQATDYYRIQVLGPSPLTGFSIVPPADPAQVSVVPTSTQTVSNISSLTFTSPPTTPVPIPSALSKALSFSQGNTASPQMKGATQLLKSVTK